MQSVRPEIVDDVAEQGRRPPKWDVIEQGGGLLTPVELLERPIDQCGISRV